jgi:ActR/RegA family two-component response regulator
VFSPESARADALKAAGLSFLPFGTGHARTAFVRKILAISPDESFLRCLRWNLEEAGYLVTLSGSLEESFFEADQSEPYLVIVDAEAISNQVWRAQKLLGWFHHRSPVLLLTSGNSPVPEQACDYCLPKNKAAENIVTCIQNLQR